MLACRPDGCMITFGAITDTQYVDMDDAHNFHMTSLRRYRNSLKMAHVAGEKFQAAEVEFIVQVDLSSYQERMPTEPSSKQACSISRVMRAQASCTPSLSAFPRCALPLKSLDHIPHLARRLDNAARRHHRRKVCRGQGRKWQDSRFSS